jgi:ABC-type Fe3+ transport system substrate-binding protein
MTRKAIGMLALSLGATAGFAAPGRAADQALIDAAKAEKQVTWYTTQAVDDLVLPLARAFEKKYAIKVGYTRVNATEIVLKVTNEARARRPEADVVDGTFAVAALKREGLVVKWQPDTVKDWPKSVVDPDGYWAGTNIYVATPAVNTEQVPAGSEPKTLNDLLDPKWKGKIVWSIIPGMATGAGFLAAVLKQEGEARARDFAGKLAKQNIAGVTFPGRTVMEQVVSGEFAIILQNFNSQAVVAAAKGAPIRWIPLSPASVVLTVTAAVKDSPRPNAAKLLVDFLTSTEGQQIFRDSDYVPADPKVLPRDPSVRPDEKNMHAEYFTPEEVDVQMPKWTDLFNEYFR